MKFYSNHLSSECRSTNSLAFISFILLLIAANVSTQAKGSERDCSMVEFQGCLKLMKSVGSDESDLALPVTQEELQSACSDLKQGVICLDDHMSHCFSAEMHQVFVMVATDAKHFINDLCDNPDVQRQYLRHAKCFRNVSLDQHKCADKYQKAGAISTDLEGKDPESLDKDRIMKKSCCALLEFVQCKNVHVAQDCGERASVFMQKHLHKITNPIMDQHCSAYTYGPDACSQRDPDTSNAIITTTAITGVNALQLFLSIILLPFYANYCFI